MEEYTTYRLGDIAECTLGKMLDQKKNKGNPQVYLGNVAVRWGSFNVDPSQTMLFEDKELDKYQAIKGDIVLCEGGEPGRCAIWEEDRPICIQKALHRIRVNEDIASPYYVYYYLTNLVKSGKAEPFFTGSTIKHLPREKLISLELSLPCFEEQKRRAAIIRSLDDKIALNNRINQNLEEQAQALYKSWFVDLEPFRDGEFVDSDLGLIPVGWRSMRAEDICPINIGKTPPRKESEWFSANKDDYTWVSISDMSDCGTYIDSSSETLTHEAIRKFNIAIVPAGSVLLSFKLTIGRVAIANKELTTNEAIARFVTNSPALTNYLYLALKNYDYSKLGSTSSIAIAVNSKIIKAMPLVYPGRDVVNKFAGIVAGLFEEIKKRQRENKVLAEIRNSALPRLMSGDSLPYMNC